MILMQDFVWWMGVVEDNNDPERLGRVKVRIFGIHTDNKEIMPTNRLPWALIMQPTTSSGTSGIGSSPIGLVQGSWVVGFFADGKDMQQPIVMGSLAGKVSSNVQTNYAILPNDVILDESGNPVLSSGGAVATAVAGNTVTATVSDLSPLSVAQKAALKTYIGQAESGGNYGATHIPTGLALGKYQFRAPALVSVGLLKRDPDSGVGYESNDVNEPSKWIGSQSGIPEFRGVSSKSAFLSNSTAQEKAMDLLLSINYSSLKKIGAIKPNDFSSESVQRTAGLLSVAHGSPVIAKKMWRAGNYENVKAYDINFSERYSNAAKAVGASEQSIPTPSAPEAIIPVSVDPAVDEIVKVTSEAFKDPAGKYPKVEYAGLPDVNKLATGYGMNTPTMQSRISERTENIETADFISWEEPLPAYCASYPNNQVFETTAGHVVEFDNTPNAERIHVYHKAGTYIEIDVNGSMVKKVKGNNDEIVENDNKLFVRGKYKLTVEGPTEIYVKNHANVIVNGDLNATIYNNVKVNTSKNIDLTAKGDFRVRAKNIKLTAEENIENYAKNKNTTVSETINNKVKNYKMTSASTPNGVFINSASNPATAISSNGLGPAPEPKAVIGYNTRILRRPDCVLDTFIVEDDEGDEDDLTQAIIQEKIQYYTDKGVGIILPGDPDDESVIPNASRNTNLKIITNCGFNSEKEVIPSATISKYFTIGSLSTNTPLVREPIVAQRGLSKIQIACNLKALAVNCLDPIKDRYPNMFITNGFRTDGVNNYRRTSSDHGAGKAADIQFSGVYSQKQLCKIAEWIVNNVPFKQVLFEYSAGSHNPWIHISYAVNSSGGLELPNNGRRFGTLKDHKWIKVNEFVPFKNS